jgi:putative FmdB family regulatory protein
MPTYEYVCKACGESFEVFQPFSDKPLKKHQACGGDLQKVFHARGIVFKGSGFYATDKRPAAKGDSKKEGSSEKSPKEKSSKEKSSKETAKASSTSSDD